MSRIKAWKFLTSLIQIFIAILSVNCFTFSNSDWNYKNEILDREVSQTDDSVLCIRFIVHIVQVLQMLIFLQIKFEFEMNHYWFISFSNRRFLDLYLFVHFSSHKNLLHHQENFIFDCFATHFFIFLNYSCGMIFERGSDLLPCLESLSGGHH